MHHASVGTLGSSVPSGPAIGPCSAGVTGTDTRGMARRLALALVAVVGLLGVLALPQPAVAHGDGEAAEGYLLVQQALGHLAHDTSSVGIDLAMEKVDDALSTEDQEGMDVAGVEAGMRALEAGQVEQARALLQDSIQDALADQPPATGYDTGTTAVVSAMPGRGGLNGEDLGWLVGSFLLVGLGLVLAYRFRPRDSVRDLRGRLNPRRQTASGDTTTSADIEAHP